MGGDRVSRGLFDLGARLRAATEGRPVPVADCAPALPPVSAIAVTVDHDGEHCYIEATDGNTTHAGTDREGLAAIAALGGVLADTHRTLVVGTLRDLANLATLAREFRDETASPVIGWWDQRSDHPGTEAVHVVTDTARMRWTLGVHPDRERDIDTWRTWMGIEETGAHALLTLARMTADGRPLAGLLEAANADAHAWERHAKRIAAGRPWWSQDSRIDAALGLASRSHAVEWFDSLRLDDPRVALAASFDGSVITGTITACDAASATLIADRPLSRLRVDSKVTAWAGGPEHAGGASLLDGRVSDATIGTDGRLSLRLGGFARKLRGVAVGDVVTVRPARVDPFMQTRGRQLLAGGFHRGGNWIAGKGKPVMRRGTVPLDVMVAAAGDD